MVEWGRRLKTEEFKFLDVISHLLASKYKYASKYK